MAAETAAQPQLKAPFPYFGGKSRIAHEVWARFGDPHTYIEPFAGSLAVLLARPSRPRREVVNDLDAFITNFWRAVCLHPSRVAKAASHPVIELDMHARHDWIHRRADVIEAVRADPEYCDPLVAGWWVWGMGCAIGGQWAQPRRLRSLPHIVAGQGVHRMSLRPADGRDACRGTEAAIRQWFTGLADRLRHVAICCGDWPRVVTDCVLNGPGTKAVLLDPPYSVADRGCVYGCESRTVAHQVRRWAIQHGRRPDLRIALCGYEGEHEMPDDWECLAWAAQGGYGNQRRTNANRMRERVWFSPHCLRPADKPAASGEATASSQARPLSQALPQRAVKARVRGR